MNVEKIKRFVSEHQTKIILVGGTVFAVALCAIGVRGKFATRKLTGAISDIANDVDIPTGFVVGEITDLWREGEWLNAIVNEVTTKDIGRLGEEFVKHGIVPDGTKITAIIGFI